MVTPEEPSSVETLLAAVANGTTISPDGPVDDPKPNNSPEDVIVPLDSVQPEAVVEPMLPVGHTLVRYTKGGWLGFPYGDLRYSVGTQPVALPDDVAKHAMTMYQGQIIPA